MQRSRYEAVLVGTNRGYGGSDAAGPHSGVLVIEFVDERVQWIHHRRSPGDQRIRSDQRIRGRR